MCVKVAGDKCECVCWGLINYFVTYRVVCVGGGGGGRGGELEKIYCETGGGVVKTLVTLIKMYPTPPSAPDNK